ncbi:sigma-E factor negative regulatory protein RseA [Glaciecola punicea ACAM 611]|jgi:sigma-E factor negative regulatory protein RseA|uniref:Sigma-E factor negative regulatory protein RseA n=1 Tax=Glaciecola punicea ACAM 611 TaxID=1121923 RepID=H5T826_9ALTE|nr:RseA family anti-sigma factor [Glaciecola punicea]OFA30653.1 transcriptional regulator [Glaciecola punicea]GAB54453.1 sigma-E factor negative regulatory protein RseA [Glaciecola punicea ACAM 611]
MIQKHENLSAMVDGEATDSERSKFAKSIMNDAELSAKWRSYHLTRDVLRKDMSSDISFDISDKIAIALHDELAMIAPKPGWRELPVVQALLPIARQSGQLAMVACVTAMVIFGVQTYNKPEITDPFRTAPPIIGPQGGLAPVSLQSASISQQDRMDQLIQQRRQINALIQDHVRQQRLRNISISDASVKAAESNEESINENGGSAK